MTICVKCTVNGRSLSGSIDPDDVSLHSCPVACAKCGERWTVKAGRQIPLTEEAK